MKRFFINILILIALLFAIAYFFDFLISSGLKKTEKNHFGFFNRLMNDTINADVIISGNSRGLGSYDLRIIDAVLNVNSLNMSVPGDPFSVSNLRQTIYDRNNKSPKLLIQNIDFLELDLYCNGYERYQYYPYIWDKDIREILKNSCFSWAEIYLPLYRYRGDYKLMGIGIFELFGIKHFKSAAKDHLNENKPWNGTAFRNMIASGEKITGATNPLAIELMDSLLQRRKSEGTEVVLVYAPIYYELKNYLQNHETILQIYRGLAEKHNALLLNYTDLSICLDSMYFMDTSHLNKAGVEIFSTKFAHDIDSLGILKKK